MLNRLLHLIVVVLVTTLACSQAYTALIGHYPLDTMSGGTTPDTTGVNGAGAITGAGITAAPGVIGNAFDFSGGTGQFVGVNDAGFGKTNFTASVWFDPDSLGNQGPLANWTNAGPSPRTFLIRTSGTNLQTFVRSGGLQTGTTANFPSETLTTAGFNHAVITYDGQTMRTYLNGEQSTNPFSFGSPSVLGEGVLGTAAIGGRGSSENDMVGLVDDVAFWDETLTDGKVAALSNLAIESALNYDANQVNQLFEVFDGTTDTAVIDGKRWFKRDSVVGSSGDVTATGGGNFSVNLDGTGGVSTAEYKIDIDSTFGGTSIDTAPGFVSLDATTGNGSNVTIDGINFSIGSADGSGNRQTANPLTTDFVFDDGAGQAVILFFGGAGDLPAGLWEVEVFINDAGAQPDMSIVGFRTNNSETIVGIVPPDDLAPALTFRFESDGVSAYDVFVREGGNNRARLNGVILRQVVPVPEPATAALALLGLPALLARRRRRA